MHQSQDVLNMMGEYNASGKMLHKFSSITSKVKQAKSKRRIMKDCTPKDQTGNLTLSNATAMKTDLLTS